MRKVSFSLVMLLLLLVPLSCGGGGGGGGSSELIPLSTSNLRIYEANDAWNYTVSGTLTFPGEPALSITGTVERQIMSSLVQSPISFDFCLDMRTNINLSVQGGGSIVASSNDYFLQDIYGGVYDFGSYSTDTGQIWINDPAAGYVLSMESPIAVGQANSYNATYNDGTAQEYMYSVVAIENVSTGLGTFEAYKVTGSMTVDYISGYSAVVSVTAWVVPEIGVSVKVEESASYYYLGELQYTLNDTATLSSTNVAY
ncbi:MAG: hypothetical protein KAR06_02180 [Deltaproteobacteria bacterium]|nr:hypothetical protein [Deltaproteobacteria bacterium]